MAEPGADPRRPLPLRLLVALPVLTAGMLWAWWPSLLGMANRWSRDPRYSHGFLVPFFALYLLYARRGQVASAPVRTNWSGLALVVAGAALRLAGTRYHLAWVDSVSLLPTLAGLAVLVGGLPALRWAGPSIGFLVFMIPLPYRVEMGLGSPLQRVATRSSCYALQTLGLPAVSEGNTILINDARIGVVEACNGLGMLFTFIAIAAGAALVLRRGLAEKAVILLSAVPIALMANVTRIVATGLMHETFGGRVADAVYHDLAGWLMMPLALVVMWTELFLLAHLFIETDREGSFGGAPIPAMGLDLRRTAGKRHDPRRAGPGPAKS